MIRDIKVGDITDPHNTSNIIFGMNSTLEDVNGVPSEFAKTVKLAGKPLQLGSVLNFQFDDDRMIHLIICHNIGQGGWDNSEKWVRLGMDYLWQAQQTEDHMFYCSSFSSVQIGTGEIGRRDGARPQDIRTAMATSFLNVTLFVRDEQIAVPVRTKWGLQPVSAWYPMRGEQKFAYVT
ncbi:MAG: hypothetical protein RL292_335 [Candidatus Parcubacteria bacterium]